MDRYRERFLYDSYADQFGVVVVDREKLVVRRGLQSNKQRF
jgi:hypothetical protein